MEISVHDYNRLKDKKYNLVQNIKYSEVKPEKIEEHQTQLKKIEQDILEAEQQENIIHYLGLRKKKMRLQQMIGSWKYYKKDTTKLEESLNGIQQEMDGLESETYHIVAPVAVKPQDEPRESSDVLNDRLDQILNKLNEIQAPQPLKSVKEPSYYIINLAWSKHSDNDTIRIVRDFLMMSNYLETSTELSDERSEYMITWKYAYDTEEEQITVKALRMCANHLLEALRTQKDGDETNAEIFNKIQKY